MIPDATHPQATYLDRILSVWEKDEDTEALADGSTRLTRLQAREQLFRLARALRDQGLAPGDSVGLFLANRAQTVLTELAVHLLGCRVVFLPPEPGPGELAGLVDQSGTRTVLVDPAFADRADAALARCRSTPSVLSLGPAPGGRESRDLLALAAAQPATHPGEAPRPGLSDVVTVLYTGGTLGRPKLAAHSRLLYDAMAGGAALAPGGDRMLATTMVTHSSGHLVMLHALLTGSTLVVLPEWDAESAFTVLREEEITVTALVPPMLSRLMDLPGCRPGALPRLRQINIGAAPIAPARLRQAVETFGPVIHQGYGQSECLGITKLPPTDLPDPADTGSPLWRSCGRPLPGTQVEIRDADGTVLAAGETGSVWVRSPAVMLGYYRDPERTEETLRDGWLRTGDLGHLDGEGFLYLVDREKDVIVTGPVGGNVYSRVLEDYLLTLPGVREAAAVGVPDERFGEAVRVFLSGEDLDPDAVSAAVTGELGPLYTPREILLLPALPLTPVGKTDKRALRNHGGDAPSAG
ncbi:AMP-binding protein [Streptomyces sp. HNM0574]|uniref:class I adenylate-forming enzyme family protein n=1 Tax=Streptomyces sp. HNM0574 TaxID=2714954 RepID=UPI00146F2940|nr:AMP-binding protein [Streptomyces sp. HNM0574]NLU70552.1 AMP-binding protein [Streptomyces sp. HNM0574]